MNALSRAERYHQATLVREMVALMRAVQSGGRSREILVEFTRRLWPDTTKQGGPFRAHGVATTVFDSIWNVMQPEGNGFFIRDSDLNLTLTSGG